MDEIDLRIQSALEGQHSTHDVTGDIMVCSGTIPQRNGLVVTAAAATVLARSNSEKAKIVADDSDANTRPSSLVMNSETHSLGGDHEPEIMTILSNEKTFKIKAKKFEKKNNNLALMAPITSGMEETKSGGGVDADANRWSPSTMHSRTESTFEDRNLESTTAISNELSPKSRAKNTEEKPNATKASTTIMAGTSNIDFRLAENENEDTDENEYVNANHSSNTDLPLIAVTFFIIVGVLILSVINIKIEANPIIYLSILGGISIVLLVMLRIINARRRKTANTRTYPHFYDKKFPKDSYSFVALYSPKTDADIFCFGIIVFLFQSTLFLLMILSVIIPRWRTTGEVDNPDSEIVNDILDVAGFIPSNVEPIVRATQIIAILASLVFPDASLMDISTGIEMFPQHWKRDQDEKVWCIAYSCILRCVQGFLATFAVFLLVMTSSNVTDIVLNFTAVSGNKESNGDNDSYSEN